MPSPKPACPSTAWSRSHRSWLLVDIPYAQDLPARRDAARDDAGVAAARGELGVRLHLDAPIAALEPSAIACCCAGANMSRFMKAR